MKCIIEIDMDSAAFQSPNGNFTAEAQGYELANILRTLAQKCEDQGVDYSRHFTARDSNGNAVGGLFVSDLKDES